MNNKLELNLVQEINGFLELNGYSCSISYITAELNPFSAKFKPDLIIERNDLFYFFEFKSASTEKFDQYYHKFISEKKNFALESIEGDVNYIFCTDNKFSEEQIKYLNEENVILWENKLDSIFLYKKIMTLIEGTKRI